MSLKIVVSLKNCRESEKLSCAQRGNLLGLGRGYFSSATSSAASCVAASSGAISGASASTPCSAGTSAGSAATSGSATCGTASAKNYTQFRNLFILLGHFLIV